MKKSICFVLVVIFLCSSTTEARRSRFGGVRRYVRVYAPSSHQSDSSLGQTTPQRPVRPILPLPSAPTSQEGRFDKPLSDFVGKTGSTLYIRNSIPEICSKDRITFTAHQANRVRVLLNRGTYRPFEYRSPARYETYYYGSASTHPEFDAAKPYCVFGTQDKRGYGDCSLPPMRQEIASAVQDPRTGAIQFSMVPREPKDLVFKSDVRRNFNPLSSVTCYPGSGGPMTVKDFMKIFDGGAEFIERGKQPTI